MFYTTQKTGLMGRFELICLCIHLFLKEPKIFQRAFADDVHYNSNEVEILHKREEESCRKTAKSKHNNINKLYLSSVVLFQPCIAEYIFECYKNAEFCC